jgi:hypothetical protein
MERYRNSVGDSGVSAYEIGSEYIIVKFSRTAKNYKYSYCGRAGQNHVENMKKLAKYGSGLNAYINKHLKDLYDK